MTLEITLFILRLLSGALLFALIILLFIAVWRGARAAGRSAETIRRHFGRIVQVDSVGEDGAPIVYPLLRLNTLGRAPYNSIVIDSGFASADHAMIVLREDQWWLEDRQSRNGTTLNGSPIAQSVVVTDGDVIGIGEARFRLELDH